MKHVLSRIAGLLATATVISGGLALGIAADADAQVILEEQGTIEPALQEYALAMEAGDVVAIIMTSEDFDTVLTLLGPNGEEVAFNDDYGGTLNSRIVYTAADSGDYTIQSKSFDGEGGDFSIEVRPATEYEVAFSLAQTSVEVQDYEAAIAAYSEAIALDDSNPEAYLGRADAYFGQAQAALEAQGEILEDPSDLEPDTRSAIVADFEEAAMLYESQGDSFTAQSLREQIQYIETGEFPDSTGGGDRAPEVEPES
ncbi:MAG: tetratricopeptide repeat protein [Cyanobacteria bacterium P01_C01_bin.120]